MSFASVPFPQAPVDAGSITQTVGEFLVAGGFLMWPILGCSVVVLGLAIERYLALRQPRIVPTAVRDAVEQICQGRTEVVAEPIREAQVPAARVLAAGLRRRGYAIAEVEKAMEDQAAKEGERMRGNVRGITLMAAVSPLLGLLGTVLGIAQAFAVVEKAGLGRPENLAEGIKVALYTTILGLFVAIPATLLAAHLQARVRRLLIHLAEALSPAVAHLAAPPAAGRPAKEDQHAA